VLEGERVTVLHQFVFTLSDSRLFTAATHRDEPEAGDAFEGSECSAVIWWPIAGVETRAVPLALLGLGDGDAVNPVYRKHARQFSAVIVITPEVRPPPRFPLVLRVQEKTLGLKRALMPPSLGENTGASAHNADNAANIYMVALARFYQALDYVGRGVLVVIVEKTVPPRSVWYGVEQAVVVEIVKSISVLIAIRRALDYDVSRHIPIARVVSVYDGLYISVGLVFNRLHRAREKSRSPTGADEYVDGIDHGNSFPIVTR